MAEPKPGDKICDRCDSMKATTQQVGRIDEVGERMGEPVKVDLCVNCGKIVDKAIKRAVRPVKASKSPPPGAPNA